MAQTKSDSFEQEFFEVFLGYGDEQGRDKKSRSCPRDRLGSYFRESVGAVAGELVVTRQTDGFDVFIYSLLSILVFSDKVVFVGASKCTLTVLSRFLNKNSAFRCERLLFRSSSSQELRSRIAGIREAIHFPLGAAIVGDSNVVFHPRAETPQEVRAVAPLLASAGIGKDIGLFRIHLKMQASRLRVLADRKSRGATKSPQREILNDFGLREIFDGFNLIEVLTEAGWVAIGCGKNGEYFVLNVDLSTSSSVIQLILESSAATDGMSSALRVNRLVSAFAPRTYQVSAVHSLRAFASKSGVGGRMAKVMAGQWQTLALGQSLGTSILIQEAGKSSALASA